MSRVQRRQFLIAAGTFLATPFARAQAPAVPVVGFLSNSSLSASSHLVAAFRRGLGEAGYVDGKNVMIEFRSSMRPSRKSSESVRARSSSIPPLSC